MTRATETMPPLPGVACPDPLDGAVEVGNLGYYDGPLTTLFRRGDDLLLVSWCSEDTVSHRWMVVPISRARLASLGDGAVPFRAIFTEPEGGTLWLTDRDGEKVNGASMVTPADLDSDILPGDGVPFPRSEWHDRAVLSEVA